MIISKKHFVADLKGKANGDKEGRGRLTLPCS